MKQINLTQKNYLLGNFVALLYLISMASCNSNPGGGNSNSRKDSNKNSDIDTAKYRVVYDNNGFVLLSKKEFNADSFASAKSQPIMDDTAARMVKHRLNNKASFKYPITIDFDYNTINLIIA
ncbi:MAG TPA: hypothetical protein VKC90_15705, partial [Chitinophagaceae bacterium]|nr:hypothetical protein [Chitinophagaceae bacterium]